MQQQPLVTPRPGNATLQRDSLGVAESWYARLNGPVAVKLGLTPAALTKLMYDHNSTGDWLEFGDRAVALKWVGTLVDSIADESVDRLAELTPPKPLFVILGSEARSRPDKDGRAYFELPPLAPGDLWMIHDPAGIYRAN